MFMDRQAEHARGVMEMEPPAEVADALAALTEILGPVLTIEFTIARGQIQLLNSRAFGH